MGLLDTIKGWFSSAKDKVGDMERDAIDQAKDIAGGIKDKFDGDGADKWRIASNRYLC